MIRERLRDLLNSIPSVELVGEADNEAEVMQSIGAIRPDVVILGYSSARDNLGVLRRIRMLPMPITVIVMTNRVYSLYRKKCMDSGADHFLDKSRDIEALSSLLSSLADATAPEISLPAIHKE